MPYRSGRCREEEARGKTENGPEKSLQVNGGMENEVSYWEHDPMSLLNTWFKFFLNGLPIVLCYPLHLPLCCNYRNAPLGPRFGWKLFLFGYCLLWCEMLPYSTLLRTEYTTATHCTTKRYRLATFSSCMSVMPVVCVLIWFLNLFL